jgi:peptidyl-prolyl cis-trans isomerase B (cyclophilin B)
MKRILLAVAVLGACAALAAVTYADDAPAEGVAKAAEHAEHAAKPEAAVKKAIKPAATDIALKAIDAQIAAAKVDKKLPTWKTSLPMPKAVAFDPAKKYFERISTSEGDVVIRFMPDIAPMHVTNFIYLTRLGFYDNTVFHRVIPSFMAQGGCPLGNGMGGPGYGFSGEFSPKVRHDKPGLLSMANTGQPNSDGSQFFLTFVPTPWLNDKHTLFGEVVEGLDVLKKLEAAGSPGAGTPTKRLSLVRASVEVR